MAPAAAEPSPDLAAGAPADTFADTFADAGLETAFRRDGFAVVPVLTGAEVADLLDFYWSEVARPDDHGLTVDHMRDDRAVMRRIAERLAPVWERVVPELFADHVAVFCTFVVKHPGPESQMSLHEDQTWVDETQFRSGTLWVPLTDVGLDLGNGALGVVPGSHRLGVAPCGAGTPDLTRPYADRLRAALVVPDLAAGTGLFYDSRALHESPPNLSGAARVALACGVVPRAADLRYVRASGRRRRTVYAVDAAFYLDHSPRRLATAMPDGYAVLEEYQAEESLPPELVAEVLGDGRPVAPVPVVPWSVWPADDPPPAMAVSLDGRRADRDLDPGPPDGPASFPGRAAVVHEGAVGEVGPLVRDELAAELGLTGVGSVLVLGPWSRATLPAVADGDPVVLEVLDAPQVASGVCDGVAAANLEPGMRLELVPDRTYHLWNGSPVPVTLVAGPAAPPAGPRPRRRVRDLLRR